MRAVLLASATAACFGVLRLSNSANQADGFVLPRRTCWISAVAPTISVLRSISSPARVITPRRVLPAVEGFFGVSPSQAPKARPGRKALGSGNLIANTVALFGRLLGVTQHCTRFSCSLYKPI